MSMHLRTIEQSASGNLRIVHNPKPRPDMSRDPEWLREVFSAHKDGDWDVVTDDGRVLESCDTEQSARQAAGFYGFMFGI